jgi:hypothetical protein
VDLDYHPNLSLPAASRYAATTPSLHRWFAKHNADRSYAEQVKPSNFLLAYQIAPAAIHECPDFVEAIIGSGSDRATPIKWPKPVAPYCNDATEAAKSCFDRDTGIAVPVQVLKTYRDALAQYHLRPENKFCNGDYADSGIMTRRHVRPLAIRQIGKESNRWQEKLYTGGEDGTEIDYGLAPENSNSYRDTLRRQIIQAGQRKVARESGVSRRTIERLLKGGQIRKSVRARISQVIRTH